jgi:serine/threonine-protein kinase
LIASGWRGLRVALMLIGALATIVLALRFAFGPKRDSPPLAPQSVGANGAERDHFREHGHTAAGKFPPNTRAALLTSAHARESGGSAQIEVGFVPGDEELDAYAGSWRLENGKLAATQGGSETGGRKLIPRAYLAHLRDLEADFPVEKNGQHFGELAFRNRDLQLSIIAIDDTVMRLLWRYEAKGIGEVSGNSADDVAKLIEDEMPTPPDGTPFTIKLTLQHHQSGTEVQGFVNGQRFAHKVLVGLNGRAGRIALGCRNQHCDFERLKVSGRTVAHPQSTKKFDPEPE